MKNHKEIKLSIRQPCHESWNEMTPEGKGRYCASCRKTVIDFSKMSDEETLRHFNRDTQNTCGRLATSQLNRNLDIKTATPPQLWKKILLGLTLSTGMINSAFAQTANPKAYTEQSPLPQENRKKWKPLKVERVLTIKAKIVEAGTKKFVPFAFVRILDTGFDTQSDRIGNFTFKLPVSAVGCTIGIACRMAGYQNYSREVMVKSADSILLIELKPTISFTVEAKQKVYGESIQMGGMIATTTYSSPRSKIRNTIYWMLHPRRIIKYWLRKR